MVAPLPELRKLELLPLQLPDCGMVVTGSASMLRSELDFFSILSDEECPPIFGEAFEVRGESLPAISKFEESFLLLKLPEVRLLADRFRSTPSFCAGRFSGKQNCSIPLKLLGNSGFDSEPPITVP
jgi:hypothetical protein